jgi:sodium/hydrogen exchanger-like protein 6/7/sodium/hydrogen exchanger 8
MKGPVKLVYSEIFIIAATLCSSDTVAALAMIKYKEHPKLFSLVFGEGIVNDAVSIILFNAVNNTFSNPDVDFQLISTAYLFLDFLRMAALSIIVGAVVGIMAAFFFKTFRFVSHNPITEICLVFFFGYSAYYISESYHLSGVISLFIAGVVLGHYNWYNLSAKGKITTQ